MSVSLSMKFRCMSVGGQEDPGKVTMQACVGPENEPWSKETPWGVLQFLVKPAIAAKMKVGADYHFSISGPVEASPAPGSEPDQG